MTVREQNEPVQRLLLDLRQHDWSMNCKTADALANLGESVIPHLLEALEDSDGYARNGAAIALGTIASQDTTQHLIRALQWRDNRVYEDAEDDEARTSAATALGKLHNKKACEALIAELENFPKLGSNLASYIADALGVIGDPKAVPVLAKVIETGDPELQNVASRALAELGPNGIKILVEKATNRDQPGRRYAIRALGAKPTKSAVPLLLQILEDPNEDRFVRCQAARSLGEIGGSTKIFPALLELLQAPDEVLWIGALHGLGALRDSRAYDVIVRQLDIASRRYAAIMALGELRDPRSCEVLIPMLKGEDESSAIHAAAALAKVGCLDALPCLIRLRDRTASSDSLLSRAHKHAVEEAIQKLQHRDLLSTPE